MKMAQVRVAEEIPSTHARMCGIFGGVTDFPKNLGWEVSSFSLIVTGMRSPEARRPDSIQEADLLDYIWNYLHYGILRRL